MHWAGAHSGHSVSSRISVIGSESFISKQNADLIPRNKEHRVGMILPISASKMKEFFVRLSLYPPACLGTYRAGKCTSAVRSQWNISKNVYIKGLLYRQCYPSHFPTHRYHCTVEQPHNLGWCGTWNRPSSPKRLFLGQSSQAGILACPDTGSPWMLGVIFVMSDLL